MGPFGVCDLRDVPQTGLIQMFHQRREEPLAGFFPSSQTLPIYLTIVGLGAAIYPTHLYMVTHLQVAVWAALLLTLLLAVVAAPRWRATRGGAILAGALAGMLLLVEPILALALPIAAAVFWTAEPRRFTRAAWAARAGPSPPSRTCWPSTGGALG